MSEDPREFAFRQFLEWVHRDDDQRGNEVVALVRGHLGGESGSAVRWSPRTCRPSTT